jgi:hypothetical protein
LLVHEFWLMSDIPAETAARSVMRQVPTADRPLMSIVSLSAEDKLTV